nr:DUF4238 domain-containing protein [Salinicola sp.]
MYTFDKLNQRKFQQSVFDATTRNSFYNIEDHPERASLEPILGIYETEAAPLIKRIIEKRNIAWLSDKDRLNIATFVAVQRARSYGEFMRIDHMVSAISGKLSKVGATLDQMESELGSEGSTERKAMFFNLILDQKDTIRHLKAKSWILYETEARDPFFISDNPVTLYNHIDMGAFGNLGVALKGIQVHLPLSSTLTLALICPSIAESAVEAKKKVKRLISTNPHLLKYLEQTFGLIKLGEAYENGTAMTQSADNVRFLNSLQVSYAEQYIFCEKDHFALAEEMIDDNERYKTGPRIQVS